MKPAYEPTIGSGFKLNRHGLLWLLLLKLALRSPRKHFNIQK